MIFLGWSQSWICRKISTKTPEGSRQTWRRIGTRKRKVQSHFRWIGSNLCWDVWILDTFSQEKVLNYWISALFTSPAFSFLKNVWKQAQKWFQKSTLINVVTKSLIGHFIEHLDQINLLGLIFEIVWLFLANDFGFCCHWSCFLYKSYKFSSLEWSIRKK